MIKGKAGMLCFLIQFVQQKINNGWGIIGVKSLRLGGLQLIVKVCKMKQH